MTNKMIALVRIKGELHLNQDIKETLFRLRLRRKFACVVLENPSEVHMGMIKKVRDLIAFGEINKETYKELVEKRGRKVEGKLKPFFRLHPPRKGIDTKMHFGETTRGVLGDNGDKINDLIRRML